MTCTWAATRGWHKSSTKNLQRCSPNKQKTIWHHLSIPLLTFLADICRTDSRSSSAVPDQKIFGAHLVLNILQTEILFPTTMMKGNMLIFASLCWLLCWNHVDSMTIHFKSLSMEVNQRRDNIILKE
ncbi:unnamed protein product [Pleuronectes platessa]|uniref:Uncharacterized protein n=1 Tax=Pleuronectes platessa TaxID=8262 RepID=A0A9N7US58_PLEPL|nr:unnamed protein product [Pleuronectes platessa]